MRASCEATHARMQARDAQTVALAERLARDGHLADATVALAGTSWPTGPGSERDPLLERTLRPWASLRHVAEEDFSDDPNPLGLRTLQGHTPSPVSAEALIRRRAHHQAISDGIAEPEGWEPWRGEHDPATPQAHREDLRAGWKRAQQLGGRLAERGDIAGACIALRASGPWPLTCGESGAQWLRPEEHRSTLALRDDANEFGAFTRARPRAVELLSERRRQHSELAATVQTPADWVSWDLETDG